MCPHMLYFTSEVGEVFMGVRNRHVSGQLVSFDSKCFVPSVNQMSQLIWHIFNYSNHTHTHTHTSQHRPKIQRWSTSFLHWAWHVIKFKCSQLEAPPAAQSSLNLNFQHFQHQNLLKKEYQNMLHNAKTHFKTNIFRRKTTQQDDCRKCLETLQKMCSRYFRGSHLYFVRVMVGKKVEFVGFAVVVSSLFPWQQNLFISRASQGCRMTNIFGVNIRRSHFCVQWAILSPKDPSSEKTLKPNAQWSSASHFSSLIANSEEMTLWLMTRQNKTSGCL